MSAGVRVVADPAALAEAAASVWEEAAAQAIRERGRFCLALSGGHTPEALYRLLARPERRARVDWARVHLFFGDERCVPPDHPDSSYRMVREALLDALDLPEEQVHRLRGEAQGGDVEAARYGSEIARWCPVREGWPQLDLALLGMGGDGHTASLFPGTGAVSRRDRAVIRVHPPAGVEPAIERLSLSAPVLEAARALLVLVEGGEKAPVLAEAIEGPEEPEKRPIELVRRARGEVLWLVDQAAASRLTARSKPA